MDAQLESITYITRGEELLWGIVLLAFSLLIHGFGMALTQYVTNRFKPRSGTSGGLLAGIATIILGSWMIMAVHIVEIMMWAGFFQWQQCFANFSTAVYFTGLEYTTVGSALNLPRHWRLLEIMVATAGLMGFAWSTAMLMTLAQDFQSQQLRFLDGLKIGRRRGSSLPVGEPPDGRAAG